MKKVLQHCNQNEQDVQSRFVAIGAKALLTNLKKSTFYASPIPQTRPQGKSKMKISKRKNFSAEVTTRKTVVRHLHEKEQRQSFKKRLHKQPSWKTSVPP